MKTTLGRAISLTAACALVLAASSDARADDAPAPAAAPVAVSASTDSTPLPAMPTVRPTDHSDVTLYQSIHPNRPLLFTGGALFLGAYTTTAVLTATNTENGNGDRTMYLPVVGPWLHLKDIKESTTDTLLIGGSGLLQGVGVGMMIASLFIPEKIPAAVIEAHGVKMTMTATADGRGSGAVGAVGTF